MKQMNPHLKTILANAILLICINLSVVGTGPYSQSMSNLEDNRLQVGMNKLKCAGELYIYPNPASDYLTVSFPNPEQSGHQLFIRDLTGKAVMILSNINEDKVVIQRGNLKAGYYSVEVIGENIYRGKMILK